MAWKDGGPWLGKMVVYGLERWWSMAWKDGGSRVGKITSGSWLEKITSGPWVGKMVVHGLKRWWFMGWKDHWWSMA